MTCFIADDPGPPHRRFYIYDDRPLDPSRGDPNVVNGWSFVVDETDGNGEPRPLRDTWEETFEEIIRYPELYARSVLIWLDQDTGQTVDLQAFNPTSG